MPTDRPVPRGVASVTVLLTNLYNVAQPLIRYKLGALGRSTQPESRRCRSKPTALFRSMT